MRIFNVLSEFFSRNPQRLSPDATRAERGKFGEDLAATHCKRELGYRIIARNWRCKRDELDLIGIDDDVLVFIEVRARDEQALVSGFHSVSPKKKDALRRGCKAYIKQLQNPPKHFRFDVIDVSITAQGEGIVQHYANVPLFSKHYTSQR